MLKVDPNYVFLALILIDFVLQKMKSIILKCFKKNVNKLKKKRRGGRYIADGIEIFSDDCDE